jgi:hypothetical protein
MYGLLRTCVRNKSLQEVDQKPPETKKYTGINTQNDSSTHCYINPHELLLHNINYGSRLWKTIFQVAHTNEDLISSLIQLALHMDEHMTNIIEICLIKQNNTLQKPIQNPAQQQIIQTLLNFYSSPELHPRQVQHHNNSIIKQVSSPSHRKDNPANQNTFSALLDYADEQTDDTMEETTHQDDTNSPEKRVLWVADTKITNLADTIRKNSFLTKNKQHKRLAMSLLPKIYTRILKKVPLKLLPPQLPEGYASI